MNDVDYDRWSTAFQCALDRLSNAMADDAVIEVLEVASTLKALLGDLEDMYLPDRDDGA